MATSVSAARRVRSGGSRVAHLVTKQGKAYSLGLTPEAATMSGYAYTVEEIPRPGRRPLTRIGAPQNRTYRFTHKLVATERRKNLVPIIDSLTYLARQGFEVRLIEVSGIEAGIWWRIRDLTVEILERDANQNPKHAQLSWDLVESFDLRPKIGRTPPPGGTFKPDLQPIPVAGSAPSYPTAPSGPDTVPDSTRDSQIPDEPTEHRVIAGQTLYSISALIWGNGYFWPFLFNANKDKLKWEDRVRRGQPTTPPPTSTRALRVGLMLAIPTLPSGTPNADYPG